MQTNLYYGTLTGAPTEKAYLHRYKREGYYKNPKGEWEINLYHYIPQLTPEMMRWGLTHIDNPDLGSIWLPAEIKTAQWLQTPVDEPIRSTGRLQLCCKLPRIPFLYHCTLITEYSPSVDGWHEYRLHTVNRKWNKLWRYECCVRWQTYEYGLQIQISYSLPGILPEVAALMLYDISYHAQQTLENRLPALYHQLHKIEMLRS